EPPFFFVPVGSGPPRRRARSRQRRGAIGTPGSLPRGAVFLRLGAFMYHPCLLSLPVTGRNMEQQAIVARLEALDACALSDALDALGSSGAVSGLQRRSTRRRIAGRVQTVRLHARAPEGGSKRHLGTAAIESADALTVIVVEQRTGIDCAGWG